MLTEFEEVRKAIIEDIEKLPRTVGIVLDMIGDKELGIKPRGFVVLSNLMQSESGRDETVKKVLLQAHATEKIKLALREIREQEILTVGIEVLQTLLGK